MVDSTATVNGLGEESLVWSDRSIYLRERERFTQSTLGGGGSIPQPFSNQKADSIKHVEIGTKRKKRRE